MGGPGNPIKMCSFISLEKFLFSLKQLITREVLEHHRLVSWDHCVVCTVLSLVHGRAVGLPAETADFLRASSTACADAHGTQLFCLPPRNGC